MKQLKLLLIGLLVAVLFFVSTSRVSEASNNPIFATIEKVRQLIERALLPLERKIDRLGSRVGDLTVRVGQLEQPGSATLSAVLRESVVKVINEEEAVNSLRSIYLAQLIFSEEDSDKNGKFDYAPALSVLFRSGSLIDSVLSGGLRMGYDFKLTLKASDLGWEVSTSPTRPGKTGDRAFYVDETGVIRAEASGSATPNSPPLSN